MDTVPSEGGWIQAIIGTKNLSSFSTNATALGRGMRNYSKIITGICDNASDEDLNFVVNVAKGLAGVMDTVPSEGGWLQEMIGTKNLSSFSTNAATFGRGMRNYSQIISGISDKASTTDLSFAVSIATGLSSVANSLPLTDGDWQKFVGEQNIATFGSAIAAFAPSLKTFAENISGFSTNVVQTDIDNAINTATALTGVADNLPKSGGSWQKFWGSQNLEDFGAQCAALGSGLASFASGIVGISVDDTTNAFAVVETLSTFMDSFTASGGWWSNITTELGGGDTKEKTLTNLVTFMVSFSAQLKEYSDNLSGLNLLKLTIETGLAKSILGQFQAILDSLTDPSDSLKQFGKYGEAIIDMGEYLSDFSDEAVKCNSAGILLAISSISSLIGLCNQATSVDPSNVDKIGQMLEAYAGLDLSIAGENLGKSFVQSIVTAINGETGSFVAAITRMSVVGVNAMNGTTGQWKNSIRILSSNVIQTLRDGTANFASATRNLSISGVNSMIATQSSWSNCAKVLASSLINGVENARSKMATAASGLSNAGASSASGTQKSWYSAGQNLGKGLANGVASMAGKVKSAAANAAAGAVNAVRNAWKVHSPSRVGLELGMYFDYGLAEGLNSYRKVVSQNAESVSKGAAESARMVLANLSTGILDNIDPNPTIRPVLDLSNVEQGVGVINGMFAANRSLNTSMFNGAASYRSAKSLTFDGVRISGGSGNKDVVAELQQLTQRFNNLTEAVTNMQLVLDTGTLVGATSAKMDSQLGTLVSRRGRGN